MSLDSMNGIEFLAAHIKFKVPGYKEKVDGQIYYQVIVQFTLREPFKRQDLSYTYQQCLQFCTNLQAQCADLPSLPAPSIFGFKPAAQEVEKRRIDLEKWLMAITWRCDVVCLREYQEFCNLQNVFDEKWLDAPSPSVELKEGHLFGVVDFHYDPETQVCFVATSDDSLVSKMAGFVNIFTGGINKSTGPIRSQILCYRLDVNDDGEPQTRQLWKNTYVNKISCIHWDEQLTILVVGFETGQILVLRVSSEKKYKEVSEFCYFVKHTESINGLATNALTGQLYSISKDKCLITTDLTNPNNILKEKEFSHELTCMIQHKEHRRLFVGDSQGSIYIFHYDDGTLQAAHQIKPNVRMCIQSLQFCPKKNFLISGSKEGIAMVFDLGRPGKENLTSLVTQIKSVNNQKSLRFSLSTKELFVNYNANVLIVDSTKVKTLYSLAAHKGGVSKIEIYEDIGLLVTAGKDGLMKFWQFKYFPHSQIDTQLITFRGDRKAQHQKEEQIEEAKQTELKQISRHLKPQLEDLDDWSH